MTLQKQYKTRCQARVMKRDTYRVNRQNGLRFKMHYTETQCSRKAVVGQWCKQHHNSGSTWPYKYAEEFMNDP